MLIMPDYMYYNNEREGRERIILREERVVKEGAKDERVKRKRPRGRDVNIHTYI